MQYPPQPQPPDLAPSEVYLPEQPQAYPPQPQVYAYQYQSAVPGQEIAQPPMRAQEIVIYPNRKSAIFRATLCTITVLFLIGLVISAFATNGPIQPSDIEPMIVALIAVFFGSLLLGWLGWRMGFQLLLSPKPILTIRREGIIVGKILILRSGFFISWADIEAIYPSSLGYKYLCIRPKNPGQSVSLLKGRVAPIMIPQMYLEKPVEEILHQLYDMYLNELNYYRIQLQP